MLHSGLTQSDQKQTESFNQHFLNITQFKNVHCKNIHFNIDRINRRV